MRKVLLSTVFATLTIISFGQQDPQFTNWMFDRLSFNPAVAGVECQHCLSAFYRDQWDGFDRDPKTALFNYNGDIGKNIGIGASFLKDNLGQERNTAFRLSGSYRFALSGGSFVNAGLSIGSYAKKLGNDWIPIDAGDPVIPNNETSQGTIDLGLGVMIHKPGVYYAGISATHINAPELGDLSIQIVRHYYFMGGYNFTLGSGDQIRTNILAKTPFSVSIFDINVNYLYQNMLWGGLSYRPGDAIAPMLGFQKQFAPVQSRTSVRQSSIMLGYSYDMTTSEIKTYSAGSHEIFLTYCFKFTDIPVRARHGNPRFL
ncbi:MAG: type IX secretion system membrane protein PorP/SprF [Flavobacteriales bacterium]|nr:type IX secretion system membrane protein PorP/SprF [Flavobacteriales bacterium]